MCIKRNHRFTRTPVTYWENRRYRGILGYHETFILYELPTITLQLLVVILE